MKYFTIIIILIVAVAVIGGFFIIGSPQQERLRLSDQRRIEDLQTIQWQIVNYWQRKGQLPVTLNDLRDDISGFVPPQDPERNKAYEYERRGQKIFVLCADFNLADAGKNLQPSYYSSQNWQHTASRSCFERTIDEDLYKTEKPRPVPAVPASH